MKKWLILYLGFTLLILSIFPLSLIGQNNHPKINNIKSIDIYAIPIIARTGMAINEKLIKKYYRKHAQINKQESMAFISDRINNLEKRNDPPNYGNIRIYCKIKTPSKKLKLYIHTGGVISIKGKYYFEDFDLVDHILEYLPHKYRRAGKQTIQK